MIRSALRAVGYVVSELIPMQGLRCVADRDYADAMYDAAAKHDGAEHDPVRAASDAYHATLRANCDGAEQLNEREAEEELWEAGDLVCPFCLSADCRDPECRAQPALTDDELVAVRQLIDERFPLLAVDDQVVGEFVFGLQEGAGLPLIESGQDMGARIASACEMFPMHTKSSADGSAQGPADGGEVVSSIPPEPTSPRPNVDWLVPAICEVLSEHIPEGDADDEWDGVRCYNPHAIEPLHKICRDQQAWREHVGPILAQHILKAIAAQPK